MPSIACIRATTSRPRSSTLSASARTIIVWTRHVLGLEHPLGPAYGVMTASAFPFRLGSGCTREPRCASSVRKGAHAIGAWAARPTQVR